MNPNDPAVFTLEVDAKGGFLLTKGLTKRELFAAMAMQGDLKASPSYWVICADCLITELSKELTK